jgi:hypothetical protein
MISPSGFLFHDFTSTPVFELMRSLIFKPVPGYFQTPHFTVWFVGRLSCASGYPKFVFENKG